MVITQMPALAIAITVLTYFQAALLAIHHPQKQSGHEA